MTRTGSPRAWLVLMLAVLSGCVSPLDQSRGLPPFYERHPTPADQSSWTLRPLVGYDQAGDTRNLGVIWPLFRDTVNGQDRRSWLLPIWYRFQRVDKDGRLDRDSAVLPFFFWGTDSEEGGYFLVFPIFGTLKGIFGKDLIKE